MDSITEIALAMAARIARQQGCTLEYFSLDGVDIEHIDGIETIHVSVSARILPVRDEIPFEAVAA